MGIRHRGHSALTDGQRWGFKVKFNEFVDGAEFHGINTINLLGTEGDYSLLRERLAQQVMRQAGIPAPRVVHAQLWVNDTFQGVFPLTEEPDSGAYLDAHFSDDGGGLYSVDGNCGGSGDFEDHGDEASDDLKEDFRGQVLDARAEAERCSPP